MDSYKFSSSRGILPLCCGEYLKDNVYRNNFHTVDEMKEIFVVIRIPAGFLS
jgi:hypothetical protein